MAHDVRSPHIFIDGPGHTASGDQVMDNLDALWAAIDTLVSPGTIRLSGAASPETGWLLCDGSAVSRTTYATLFGKLGTAFGVGDGSTTFNLPDLRGRAPIGAGTGSGLTARTLGAKVGAESVTLTAAQSGVPAHTHPTASGGSVLSDAGGTFTTSGTDVVGLKVTTVAANAAANAASSHENTAASQVVNYFIKT